MLDGAVHHAVVCQAEGRHPKLGGSPGHRPDLAGAVEERVLAVHMEVDGHGAILASRADVTRAQTRCLRAAVLTEARPASGGFAMSLAEPPRPAGEPPADRPGPSVARPATQVYAPIATALLCVSFAWWALADGAYFPTVLLPGLIIFCGGLAVIVIGASREPETRRRLALPGAVAALALIGLAAWSALSALWSPAPDVALSDGLRIAAFALAFILGGYIAVGAGGRRELALFPLAFAGLVAGAVTLIRLIAGADPAAILDIDGTLLAPLGYRNATAAFFLLAFFAAVGVGPVADPRLAAARGLAGGTATLCAGMGVICQSRATIPAVAIAALVFVIASPIRLRTLSWLAITFLPALFVVPSMLALFQATESARVAAIGVEMSAAGMAIGLSSAVSLVIAAALARFGERAPGTGTESPRANRAIVISIGALIAAAFLAFLIAVGDPVRWVDGRLDELRSLESPTFAGSSTRFGLSVGSGRLDLWRTARR